MNCEDCEYYDADDNYCKAFECNGIDCPTLPCEEKEMKEIKPRKERSICENCGYYLYNGDIDEFICTNVDSTLCGEILAPNDWCRAFKRLNHDKG